MTDNDQPDRVSPRGFRTQPCRACRVPIIWASLGDGWLAVDVPPPPEPPRESADAPAEAAPAVPVRRGRVKPPDVLLVDKGERFHPAALVRTQEELFGETKQVYQRHSRTCEKRALRKAQARKRRNSGRSM